MQEEARLASRFGLSRATLRHYRDAYGLTEALPSREAMQIRRQASALGASSLGRWWAQDATAVAAFLRGRAEISNAAVRSALEEHQAGSRPRAQKALPLEDRLECISADNQAPRAAPRSVFAMLAEQALYGRVPGVVDPAVARFYGIGFEAIMDRAQLEPARPRMAWRRVGKTIQNAAAWAGLIEVRPMVVLERYAREARNIWTRAVAASAHYGAVVIVSPNTAARRQLLSSIPPETAKVWTGHPTDPERCLGRRRGVSIPIVAGTSEALGVIVFSTPTSLAQDLTMEMGLTWRRLEPEQGGADGSSIEPDVSAGAGGRVLRWSDAGRLPG